MKSCSGFTFFQPKRLVGSRAMLICRCEPHICVPFYFSAKCRLASTELLFEAPSLRVMCDSRAGMKGGDEVHSSDDDKHDRSESEYGMRTIKCKDDLSRPDADERDVQWSEHGHMETHVHE